MLLAYVDESGNTGDVQRGGTLTFCLGCVLVDADQRPHAFDEFLDFRRRLNSSHRVPIRAEVKVSYLLRNSGDLRPVNLGVGVRHVIYRAHLRMLQHLPVRAFGIVVDKRRRNLSPSRML